MVKGNISISFSKKIKCGSVYDRFTPLLAHNDTNILRVFTAGWGSADNRLVERVAVITGFSLVLTSFKYQQRITAQILLQG